MSSFWEVPADWLVVGVWEDGDLGGAAAEIDARLGGALARLKQKGDVAGKANELTPLLNPSGLAAERILVVGLGKRANADRISLSEAAAAAGKCISNKQRSRVVFALPEDFPGLSWSDVVTAVGVGFMQGCFGPGLRKSEPTRFAPEEVLLAAPPSASEEELQLGIRRADVEGRAVWLARELVNLPPCDLYPESFAERARESVAAFGVDCVVLDEKQLEAERMGALLGVARGSDRPPRLVVLHYRRGTNGRTLGLVGKGVTFDSGGLSLKSAEHMVDMKCDMAGAAAVLAAVCACAELQMPVNLLGVLALVENMPSGKALKVGDVLRSRSGKTIEVLNTDAEGRLILADALTYAVDQHADHLVDLATLTGACLIALGTEVAGLMGNDEAWLHRVREAAQNAGERVWPLPMLPLYNDMIKSSVADMKNTGGSRNAGAISAAKMLEQFVGKTPWAHLDIAGPAWVERENATRDAGGTGCFVRTLVALAQEYGKR